MRNLPAIDSEPTLRPSGSAFRLKPLSVVFRDRDHGWGPLIWMVYFGFFFIHPIVDHVSAKEWALDILGFFGFLFFYLGLFMFERPRGYFHIAGLIVLGMLYVPYNGGATSFFIFAAAMLPFVAQNTFRSIIGLLLVVSIAGLEGWLFHLDGWVIFYSAVFPLIVGSSNIFFAERNRMNRKLRRANEEIEHLAKVAERERIARDLHDVLGHTLSVITLKSELAGKLIARDPERAGKEIAEVEQISRQALSEVRAAIGGYRAQGIAAELARARSTLETAGLTVQFDAATMVKLPAMQESVLSLAVREAVTNVVRHAQAQSCRLRLEQVNGSCRLEIHDDGRGTRSTEGNGLRGMRERVEMLGGTLQRDTESGTTLTIILPLKDITKADKQLDESRQN